jgi:hypothetical protein
MAKSPARDLHLVNATIRSTAGIPATITKARRPPAERPVLVTSLEGQPDR